MAVINWLVATVTAIHAETPRVKTISLDVPGWMDTEPASTSTSG